jgi:diguanylate cyclase (GGDEF)-like protein
MISIILFIITLDVMAIVLAKITYQTSQRSYEANEKLRQQYEINQELTKKLEYEANYDLLTQMYNRRGFNGYLKHLTTVSSNKRAITTVIIDIDYFKQYNDFYGHAKGDTVLKLVASAIIKVSDTFGFIPARWGGEEFIAVGQLDKEEDIYAFGQQLIEEVAQLKLSHIQSDIASNVTVSLGSATVCCEEDYTISASFELADQALYQAKGEGRNRHIHIAEKKEKNCIL